MKTPMFWKKQMQIGLVKSRHSAVFFEEYEDYLSTKDNLILLLDIINLYAFEIISDGKNFEMVFSKENLLKNTRLYLGGNIIYH